MFKLFGGREKGCKLTANVFLKEDKNWEDETSMASDPEQEQASRDDYAKNQWAMYNAFIAVGFSKRQAFDLVAMMVAGDA